VKWRIQSHEISQPLFSIQVIPQNQPKSRMCVTLNNSYFLWNFLLSPRPTPHLPAAHNTNTFATTVIFLHPEDEPFFRDKAPNYVTSVTPLISGFVFRKLCFQTPIKPRRRGISYKLVEVTGRQGRRHKQPLDDLQEKTEYWKLNEEALDRTLCRTRFGRGCGPVVRQTIE
jgi:hypothetical protein